MIIRKGRRSIHLPEYGAHCALSLNIKGAWAIVEMVSAEDLIEFGETRFNGIYKFAVVINGSGNPELWLSHRAHHQMRAAFTYHVPKHL